MATLKECRRRRLLSIAGLAKAAGVSTRTIVDIEHGRTVPRLLTIRKLSEQLEIDPVDVEEFQRAIEGERDDEGKLVA
jgi:DNA-binding XRE family transcriptional regulator